MAAGGAAGDVAVATDDHDAPSHAYRSLKNVGTAVVVLDAENRPYLPRRAPRQAVFPGGFHCTASGETVWLEETVPDFDAIFTANICRELEEEVGLHRADLDWIRPLALCRELLRSGKARCVISVSARAWT